MRSSASGCRPATDPRGGPRTVLPILRWTDLPNGNRVLTRPRLIRLGPSLMLLSSLPRVLMGALASACAAGAGCAQSGTTDDAHFVVTDTIVNPDLQPFTATIGSVGNGHRLSVDSGFEPRVFRTMMQATMSAPDRIVAPPSAISQYELVANRRARWIRSGGSADCKRRLPISPH